LNDDKIKFDKNGKEIPEKYLFGKIPIYKNEYNDWPFWKLALVVAPMAIGLALFRNGFFN